MCKLSVHLSCSRVLRLPSSSSISSSLVSSHSTRSWRWIDPNHSTPQTSWGWRRRKAMSCTTCCSCSLYSTTEPHSRYKTLNYTNSEPRYKTGTYPTTFFLLCSAMDSGTRLLPRMLMLSITMTTRPAALTLPPPSMWPTLPTHCDDEAGDGHGPAPPSCALLQVESNIPLHKTTLNERFRTN